MKNISKDKNTDENFMRLAIDQANIAEENDDVPIGAIIVYKNQIIGKAYNQLEQFKYPTIHAKMLFLHIF